MRRPTRAEGARLLRHASDWKFDELADGNAAVNTRH
jgi:hypothetical protein